MDPTTLFGTIHKSHCTISANFYLYLQHFQQKVFNFSKIIEFQTDPTFGDFFFLSLSLFTMFLIHKFHATI